MLFPGALHFPVIDLEWVDDTGVAKVRWRNGLAVEWLPM